MMTWHDDVAGTGTWRVHDASLPLWAESNWPAEMYTRLYPHGAPRLAESLMLLGTGVLGALLTYAAVFVSKQAYKQSYKQL